MLAYEWDPSSNEQIVMLNVSVCVSYPSKYFAQIITAICKGGDIIISLAVDKGLRLRKHKVQPWDLHMQQ